MASRRGLANKHRRFVDANRYLYDSLLASQNGVCAICGAKPGKNRKLDIDHDHKRMVVRGLLCWKCNKYLPDAMDSTWLRKAADYVGRTESMADDSD